MKRWYGNQDPWKSVFVDDRREVTANDRSGKLDKTSWNAVQQVRPHHGDTLLDGDAQSVRYREIIHDGSGQPDSANSQDEANSETFAMGSYAAEFSNRAKRSSAKKTEKNVESGEEHSIIW